LCFNVNNGDLFIFYKKALIGNKILTLTFFSIYLNVLNNQTVGYLSINIKKVAQISFHLDVE